MGRKALGKEPYTATMTKALLRRFDVETAKLGRTRSDVLEELARFWIAAIDDAKLHPAPKPVRRKRTT